MSTIHQAKEFVSPSLFWDIQAFLPFAGGRRDDWLRDTPE